MKFLLDLSPQRVREKQAGSALVGGQLLTPLTGFQNWGGVFAIDNGAYSGFKADAFARLLSRNEQRKNECLFVTIPDVVGNARRTLDVWAYRHSIAPYWDHALVAQDGIESMDIPWDGVSTLFVGGRDPWKDSQASLDIVRTAKILGRHVHIGRVNTLARYELFAAAGADTCDGSGVCMYDHMLRDIEDGLNHTPAPTLFGEEA